MRRLAGNHADAFFFGSVQRYAPYSSLGLVLDAFLCLGGSIPMAEQEAAFFDFLLELVVGVDLHDVGVAVSKRLLVNVFLNIFEEVFYMFLYALQR